MGEVKLVNVSDLKKGPIRHETLPNELLERIRSVHAVVRPYFSGTLEEWEIDFMRDLRPEREVAVWEAIVLAWRQYHEKHVKVDQLPHQQEKRLFTALLQLANGETRIRELRVPTEVGLKLKGIWRAVLEGNEHS